MEKLKVVGIISACILVFYCMLVNKMYESQDEDRELCQSTGGTWDDEGLKPWWLTEGVCHR